MLRSGNSKAKLFFLKLFLSFRSFESIIFFQVSLWSEGIKFSEQHTIKVNCAEGGRHSRNVL